ncbi:UNVERIFIED_CONTAM: hypothetical protein FKN15_025189 [Acipenser sinensis]
MPSLTSAPGAPLPSIELQVQEQPPHVRAAVYCHLEAFVPCNKDMLLKRVRKLNLNVQVSTRENERERENERVDCSVF